MNWKNHSSNSLAFIFLIGLLFLGASYFLLLTSTHYFIVLSGLFIFAMCGFLLSISNLQYCYYFLAVCLPFSFKYELGASGLELLFPSEIITALIALALILKWAQHGFQNTKLLKQPVSILLVIYLILYAVSAMHTTMPLVSFKSFLVRLTYILVFYFGVLDVFHSDKKAVGKLFLNYGSSLFIVAIYALYFQSQYNWGKHAAVVSVKPFYSDHTIFSACAVFILPALWIYFNLDERVKNKHRIRILGNLCVLIFLVSIFYTYCRAAWISIFALLLFSMCISVKLKPRSYILIFLLTVAIVSVKKEELFFSFKENKSISTAATTSALEQTQSITNVSTDASNAERLNRWSCAWRMFLDEPILGFGPGTFQFQYLSYQLTDETTYISVFNPYNIKLGQGGSAHNEYLLQLSEMGILCFLIFLLIILQTLSTALKALQTETQHKRRQLLLGAILGFFSYLIHAFFNNFLDTDKAAFLFYLAIAIIALMNQEKQDEDRLVT